MPNEMNHAEVVADNLVALSKELASSPDIWKQTTVIQAASIIYRIANGKYEKVVYCKDCKFWLDDGFGKMCCRRVGITRKADFYCANGKRKDDNHEID